MGDDQGRQRRLKLSRETLRDLSPQGAEAQRVRGGTLAQSVTCVQPSGCVQCANLTFGCPDKTTGTVPTGVDCVPKQHISGVDCRAGRYWIEHRLLVEHEVLEDDSVVTRRVQFERGEGIPADQFDPSRGIRGEGG